MSNNTSQLGSIQVSSNQESIPGTYAPVASLGCVITIVSATDPTPAGQLIIVNPINIQTINSVSASGSCEIVLGPLNNPIQSTSTEITGFQSYADVIPVMSFVSVCLRRGTDEYPVFVGVVTEISEDYSRESKTVLHTTHLHCEDMGYYLSHTSFFSLSFLGTENAALASVGGVPGAAAVAAGYVNKTPMQTAQFYYDQVVSWYLGRTQLNTYGEGGNIVSNILSPYFGDLDFPGYDPFQNVFPFVAPFYASDGSWLSKYSMFFPPPFYEMFVLPLVAGGPTTIGPTITNYMSTSSIPFTGGTVQVPGHLGIYDVFTAFICRQTPYPYVASPQVLPMNNSPSGTTTYITETTPNLQLYDYNWNNLFPAIIENKSIIESNLAFDVSKIYSFYVLNPQQMSNMYGQANLAQAINFFFIVNAFGLILDSNAYAKFGYKPKTTDIDWFYTGFDKTNTVTASQQNYAIFLSNLSLFAAQINTPTLVTMSGTIFIPLTPSIVPGIEVLCYPFARSEQWRFYVTKVAHKFDFGNRSYTELTVERGLPTSVYNDSTLLMAILLGRGLVKDGEYTIAPSGGLALIGFTNANSIVETTTKAMTNPQGQ